MERITVDYQHYQNMVSCLRGINDAIRDVEKQRCLDIVENYRVSVGNSPAGELACQWTMDALKEIAYEIRNG